LSAAVEVEVEVDCRESARALSPARRPTKPN
jgi:hypothetical protein